MRCPTQSKTSTWLPNRYLRNDSVLSASVWLNDTKLYALHVRRQSNRRTRLQTTGILHSQSGYLETWMVVLLTMRISQYLPYFRKASQMNSEGVLWPRLDRFISFPNSISMRNSWLFTAVWAGRFHQGSCKVYGNIPGFLNSRRITQHHKQILWHRELWFV